MGRLQPATWPSLCLSSAYCSSQPCRSPLPHKRRTSSNSQKASLICRLWSPRSKPENSSPRSRAMVPSLSSLLKPANIEQLDAILKYHVISGAAIFADKLLRSTDVKTLQGQTLSITKVNGTLTVQKAKVIKADVAATNGVVHVIDGVLSPPKNIVQLAASMPDLSTLVTALKAGKLITFLSQGLAEGSSFTVFAPTNEAFAALPAATLASLLKPANIKQLDAILEYHVIFGPAIYAEAFMSNQFIKTQEGQLLSINKENATITVQKAKVIQADLAATNGVVHVIDGVLSPPSTRSAALALVSPI